MRPFLSILLLLLLFAPVNAVAEEQLDAAILNLETDKKNEDLAETLTSVVRNEALQVEKYKVVNKFPIRLSDIALLVGCNAENPSCLKQVAAEVEARILIYGLVKRQGETSYQIEVNVYDVGTGQMLNRLTRTLTDKDPVVGFRKEIEQFFAEQRAIPTTRLQVGSSVEGAQVRIEDSFVGVAPLERKGLEPGRYTIQVAHPDYQVWETVVELEPGAKESVWAQLQPLEEGKTETIVIERDPKPAEPLPEDPRGLNWGAWSALSVGTLALGGSLAFGIGLESTERTLEKEAAAGELTEARYQKLFDRGKNYELAHRVLLGVGTVGVATGVIWLIVDGMSDRRRAQLIVGPSSAAVRWQW